MSKSEKTIHGIEFLITCYKDRIVFCEREKLGAEQSIRLGINGQISAYEETLLHLEALLEMAKGD